MVLVLLGVLFVSVNARFAGRSGARRVAALSDEQVRIQDEVHRPGTDWPAVSLLALAAADGLLVVLFDRGIGIMWPLCAAALAVTAMLARRSSRANVHAGFTERQLQPLYRHEVSAARTKRIRVFGAMALAGYPVYRLLLGVVEQSGPQWLAVPGYFALLLACVGAIGLVFAMAWRYGDEQPESTRQSS